MRCEKKLKIEKENRNPRVKNYFKMAILFIDDIFQQIQTLINEIEVEANLSFSTEGAGDILQRTLKSFFDLHQNDCREIIKNTHHLSSIFVNFETLYRQKLPILAREMGYIHTLPPTLWHRLADCAVDLFIANITDDRLAKIRNSEWDLRQVTNRLTETNYNIIATIKNQNRQRLNIDEI